MSQRIYVGARVEMDENGRMFPRQIIWADGRHFDIDRVVDVRPAAAAKAGGQGDRYTVEVHGRRRYLFFERSADISGPMVGRWFVESKD